MATEDETPVDASAGQRRVSAGSTAVFTMRQAAEVAGVSVSTLRRRRTELTAAGAVIDASGWQVPITALIAVGLIPGEGEQPPRTETSPPADSEPAAATEAATVEQLRVQVRQLTEQVAEWRRRAEVAEARAEERGRSLESLWVANETEGMALRMLTNSSTQPPVDAPAATAVPEHPVAPQPATRSGPSTPPAAERRGGFFRRLFTD